MAIPSTYRWIAVGSLKIRENNSSEDYEVEFHICDLISALKDRIIDENHCRSYSKNTKIMWCDAIAEEGDYYHLMMQIADKNVSGVSYVNFENMKTRDIKKKDHEGGHYSGHVIIRKKQEANGRYKILVEKIPGIHFSSLESHFNWVCKGQKYQKEVSNSDGEEKSFRSIYKIDGYQSKTIGEALKAGILQDIEFVNHKDSHEDGLDEDPVFKEEIMKAHLVVKQKVNEDQARNIFMKAKDYAAEFKKYGDNTKAFVRIKASNGQTKQTEIKIEEEEILAQAFVQNEIVDGFEPPLTSRQEGFRADMIQKMIEIEKNKI